MNFIKTYFKIFIGISVLILTLVVFACTMKKTDNIEVSTLKDWQRVSTERRIAAVQMLVASNENLDILVKCVDKMATLDGALEMEIRDAVSLCQSGLLMKEHL